MIQKNKYEDPASISNFQKPDTRNWLVFEKSDTRPILVGRVSDFSNWLQMCVFLAF
jgi:hypothetical protein